MRSTWLIGGLAGALLFAGAAAAQTSYGLPPLPAAPKAPGPPQPPKPPKPAGFVPVQPYRPVDPFAGQRRRPPPGSFDPARPAPKPKDPFAFGGG